MASKRLHYAVKTAPNSVRAEFLLARWEHEYLERYWQVTGQEDQHAEASLRPSKRQKTQKNGTRAENGSDEAEETSALQFRIHKSWPSKFLPVIPLKASKQEAKELEWSGKTATDPIMTAAGILDFCLMFPICNHIVVQMIEEKLLQNPRYGNILAAMAPAESLPPVPYSEALAPQKDATDQYQHEAKVAWSGFPVHHLPRRLFGDFKRASTTFPPGQDPRSGVFDSERKDGIPRGSIEVQFLRYHFLTFGDLSEIPPEADLWLILRIILLHCPPSETKLLVNSHDGYALTKAVFAKKNLLVAFLLSVGADPNLKDGLAFRVACKSNWLEGARLLVEVENDYTYKAWRRAKKSLRAWLLKNGESRSLVIDEWARKETKRMRKAATIFEGSKAAATEQNLDSRAVGAQGGGPPEMPEVVTDFTPCIDDVVAKRYRNRFERRKRRIGDKDAGVRGYDDYHFDRVRLEPNRLLRIAIQSGSRDVAQWLQHEKSVAPDLKTVQMLQDMSKKKVR